MSSRIPSEFVPLDVNYAHDRAIRQAGPLAELLFVRGIAYARRMKTEGRIPDYDLPVAGVGIPNVAKHAQSLVTTRLWVIDRGGWRIRSWEKWNPVSEQERRDKQSEGGRLGNHNRWHKDEPSTDCEFCGAIGTESVTDRVGESLPHRFGSPEVEGEEEGEPMGSPSSSSVTSVTRATAVGR